MKSSAHREGKQTGGKAQPRSSAGRRRSGALEEPDQRSVSNMFLLLLLAGLLLQGDAQDQASLWRGNDRSGRCVYSFTVPSPVEASCPQPAAPEVEALKARLGVLEMLVSQLSGKSLQPPGGRQGVGDRAQAELQDALNRAVAERSLLQGEKERLKREMKALQLRMEEMRRETERLRKRPCPQTPAAPPSHPQRDRAPTRPLEGKGGAHMLYRHLNTVDNISSLDFVGTFFVTVVDFLQRNVHVLSKQMEIPTFRMPLAFP